MSALVLITVLVLLQSSARAEFALSPGKWEVGTVAEGDKLSLTVTVTNPTTSPTSLRRVFHSCDCLSVRYTPLLLKPMESTTAELSFIAWGLDENFEFLLYFEGDGMSVVSFPIRGRFKGGGKARVYPELPVTPEGRALVIHFFFSPSCVGCDEIIAGPVRKVLEEFGDRVGFAAYDLSDATDNRRNYRLMRAFEEKHGLNDYAPVEIFVGSEALVGKEAVRTGLRDAVVRQLGLPDNTAVPPAPLVADDPALFDAATFGGAVVFGLVDGINPCVFAGLLLFFSCLVVSGLSGARLLAVGLVYALAVFLTYFAMGFALFSFFHGSAAFPLLRTATLALACGLAAVGAVLSARDALVAARGDASRLWLQLPHSQIGRAHV